MVAMINARNKPLDKIKKHLTPDSEFPLLFVATLRENSQCLEGDEGKRLVRVEEAPLPRDPGNSKSLFLSISLTGK
jgi:hypothetical protein